MFKFGVKIILVALVALGAYLYFTQDTDDRHPTVDVAELSYQETVNGAQGLEHSAQETEGEFSEDEQLNTSTLEPEDSDLRPQDSVDLPEESEPSESEEPEDLPAQYNLAVPFTSQAPHANWDLPYQEACEEASAYMVSEYYAGAASGQIDADTADAAILDIVSFEDDFLGTHLDTTAEQTVQFIDFYFNLQATVIENPTAAQIKAEIAAGRPVIVPAAGRELGNPNFTGAGPLYHMLVIKGYTEDKFITNDPGTRNGESYVYDIDVIMDAMGDWNDGDPAHGAKRVIFVSP